MTASTLSEGLANLGIPQVATFVVAATLVRLAVLRSRSGPARLAAEILESALVVVAGIYLIVRPFVCQGYFIPSPSMEPTLIGKDGHGDRILVNKFAYRVTSPHRNDIVVFIPPPNALDDPSEAPDGKPVNFIKRLIGLPGDRIQTTAGRVWMGGQPYSHTVIRERLAAAGELGDEPSDGDSQADHHIKFSKECVLIDGKPVANSKLAAILTGDSQTPVRIEPGRTLINGVALDEPFIAEDPDYDMQLFHGESLRLDSSDCTLDGISISPEEYFRDVRSKPESIPPGEYFMMGDNRNDSRDSTIWGLLSSDRIVGRAQIVFWPLSRLRGIQ